MTSSGFAIPPDQNASHTRSTLFFSSPVITRSRLIHGRECVAERLGLELADRHGRALWCIFTTGACPGQKGEPQDPRGLPDHDTGVPAESNALDAQVCCQAVFCAGGTAPPSLGVASRRIR